MYEVFRAMRTLDMEWKVLNPYHVIARKKPENPLADPVSFLMMIVAVHFNTANNLLFSSRRCLFNCIKWISAVIFSTSRA